jgi:hypothetical protein
VTPFNSTAYRRGFIALLLAFTLGQVRAQIAVPLSGVTVTFDTAPPILEWSALSVGGDNGAGVVSTTSDLDLRVQELSVAMISNALPTATVYPPSQFNYARWNSSARLVQSRPGNNWFAVFVGKFLNTSGAAIQTFEVSYQLNQGALASETIPGFRVYFSVSGDYASWYSVEGLSTDQTGRVSTVISLAETPVWAWYPGAMFYLLWADDNGPLSDGYYTVDDVSITLQPRLAIRSTATNEVELSWPEQWPNCSVEATTNLVAKQWAPVSSAEVRTNGLWTCRVPVSEPTFFRLRSNVVIP